MELFRNNISTTLQKIQSPHAVFSPACYTHCVLETDQFWQIHVGKYNDVSVLSEFYFNDFSGVIMDDCSGFNCSIGCPANPGKPDRFCF